MIIQVRECRVGKCEIENIKVLDYSFFPNAFGDYNDITLIEPTQYNLTYGFMMFSAIFMRTGLLNMSPLPSANGAHASCWIPSLARKTLEAFC